MSALSDTITLGLVLILVFGSACLYLYTRIQQSEAKINLLESILLDLKMTNELKSYPTMSYPVMSEDDTRVHVVDHPQTHMDTAELKQDVSSNMVAPFIDDHDESHEESHEETKEEQKSSSVKLTPNYEAMTNAELKAIAKQKGLSGTSNLRRAQLLEALKRADENHVSVLDSLSGEMSSIAETSELVEPEPAPNAELA